MDPLFRDKAASLGFVLAEADWEALLRFRELLEQANRRLALTKHTALADFLERHILDSLSLARALALCGQAPPARIVDLGSGAGIPAIPLALALPRHARYHTEGVKPPQVVAVESVGKKAAFIAEAAGALGLGERLQVAAERAETLARSVPWRDGFDLAVARALAPLPSLVELALPFLRPGGLLVAMKTGRSATAELAAAAAAIAALAGRFAEAVPAGIAGRDHVLLCVAKLAPTPARFPRRVGLAQSRPLG